MTYTDISVLIESLGYSHSAIKWNSTVPVPDIFIRYYLVGNNPATSFNENETEVMQARYTFEVNTRKGKDFEAIFKKVKELLENENGFNVFFNIGDGIHADTGHYYKSGDIYYQETK